MLYLFQKDLRICKFRRQSAQLSQIDTGHLQLLFTMGDLSQREKEFKPVNTLIQI